MPEPNRIVIDKVDWKRVLPVLRLVSAFKHALQPGKLVLAFLAVLAIHLSGSVWDLLLYDADEPGAYAEVLGMYASGAERLVYAALDFNFSFDEMNSVPNILGRMVLWVPAMMFQTYPWFTLLFGIDLLFVLALTSGVLTRMSVSQVCQNKSTPLGKAGGFVLRRWAWYLLTPLMPAMLILIVGAILALVGLVLFNLPGADLLGSLGYGLFLFLGFIIAAVATLLILALFLMPPALSVEGSDGFDAIARCFNYILFRPWQFGLYLLASVLYLAVVYVLVGVVASLTMDATAYFVEIGAMRGGQASDFADQSRFETIIAGDADELGGTLKVSAWIMARWFELIAAVVIALLLSTFCCLQTQVYVLMRRSADGTPLDQYDGSEPGELWAQSAAEQVEPSASNQAEG